MHEAAYNGAWQVLEALVKNGVPVTAETFETVGTNSNPYEFEPLKAENFTKSMQVLIGTGALKGMSAEQKRTILGRSIFTRQPGSNTEVIRQLLQAGLDPRDKGTSDKSLVELFQETQASMGNGGGPRPEVLALLGIAPVADSR